MCGFVGRVGKCNNKPVYVPKAKNRIPLCMGCLEYWFNLCKSERVPNGEIAHELEMDNYISLTPKSKDYLNKIKLELLVG